MLNSLATSGLAPNYGLNPEHLWLLAGTLPRSRSSSLLCSLEWFFLFFVWVDFISSVAECCSLKPVSGVIIESRQNQCPFWKVLRGQEASMRSAVFSYVSQLQFAEGTKLHLCIVERNSATPVHRRFSLT